MRVLSSTNQAFRCRPAATAKARFPVRVQAAARAGTWTLSRLIALRWSSKLSGLDWPSRWT